MPVRTQKAVASFALLLSIAFCFASSASAQRVVPKPDKISAIKASTLGSDQEGGFDNLADIFDYGRREDGSVFAGTGAANDYVNFLLVMVEVTGEGFGQKIELRATEGRKLVYRKITETYANLGERGKEPPKSYAFFLIDGARCESLKLTARLIVPRGQRGSTMTKVIEFGCGE